MYAYVLLRALLFYLWFLKDYVANYMSIIQAKYIQAMQYMKYT